jgi:hypothetical protein
MTLLFDIFNILHTITLTTYSRAADAEVSSLKRMLEGAVAAKDSADVSLTAARDENSRLSQQLAQLETTLAHKVVLLLLLILFQ